jgi:hypothetical protein
MARPKQAVLAQMMIVQIRPPVKSAGSFCLDNTEMAIGG